MPEGEGPSRERLVGRWIHSHEEDGEDRQVFRPAEHPMPPSRGREVLELREDGTYVGRRPGPADAPLEITGSWSLAGRELVISELEPGPVERAITVLDVEPDRLVTRK